jgi:hypothetical protein
MKLLHPFLFGLYFVLTLAASNTTELKGWQDLGWPILVSLVACSLCWAAGFALTREPQKAATVGLLWFVAFSVFGYVTETLRAAGTLGLIGHELGLGALFAVGLFGPTLAIRRSVRPLEPVNRYLSLVALLLLGFTTVQLYQGMLRDQDPRAVLPLPALLPDAASSGDRPDIYLVVLDKYTGGEVLEQHFGFDNGEFEGFLRSRGFVVPRSSRANYPMTLLALASMLNLDYIQNLPRELNLHEVIENNRLAGFLKAQGYRFAFFPTGYRLTSQNRTADVQLTAPKEDIAEFAAVWVATTMLPELSTGLCALAGCEAGRFLLRAQAAEIMDWKFERMKELAGGDSPTFVLAHLSLPHEPYLYHADCSHREPYWPAGFGLLRDVAANRGYLDQIRCANRKVAALVDSILARSSRPPVILLQADHGHGRFGKLPPLEKLTPYQLRERMSVFSAYLLPGLPSGVIADSITPVNAVRLVLRHYFGADLPPLEDAGYWAQKDTPLQMKRIRY